MPFAILVDVGSAAAAVRMAFPHLRAWRITYSIFNSRSECRAPATGQTIRYDAIRYDMYDDAYITRGVRPQKERFLQVNTWAIERATSGGGAG